MFEVAALLCVVGADTALREGFDMGRGRARRTGRELGEAYVRTVGQNKEKNERRLGLFDAALTFQLSGEKEMLDSWDFPNVLVAIVRSYLLGDELGLLLSIDPQLSIDPHIGTPSPVSALVLGGQNREIGLLNSLKKLTL